ncbi:MAG: hypothetical protein AAGA27_03640 [Pseudomonadota bacterium]
MIIHHYGDHPGEIIVDLLLRFDFDKKEIATYLGVNIRKINKLLLFRAYADALNQQQLDKLIRLYKRFLEN